MEDERERSKREPNYKRSDSSIKNNKEMEASTSVGPTILFHWMWNWVSTIPKAVTHFYSDLKSGEFLARFTLLDAMMQFIVAIATSCHPQEDTYEKEFDEQKSNRNEGLQSGRKICDGVEVFGGKGRTLRPRVVQSN